MSITSQYVQLLLVVAVIGVYFLWAHVADRVDRADARIEELERRVRDLERRVEDDADDGSGQEWRDWHALAIYEEWHVDG